MKKKLLQNRIAESKLTQPYAILFAAVVWLLCGVADGQWWIQLGCFALTTILMVQLNKLHALIRIYSRIVTSSFLALSCAACFLFPSLRGGVMQLSVVAFYTILFLTYQDKLSAGKTFYAFACLGVGTMAYAQLLYFVPLFWIFMATNLLMLSWRTWGASVIGLLAPYWFACCWMVLQGEYAPLIDHMATLANFQFPVNYGRIGIGFMSVMALLIVITIMGIIHYLNTNFADSIRIRLLYGIFIWTDLLAITWICIQPQHQDMLLRMIIINSSPLIGHFLALTKTKLTNQATWMLIAATLIITAYNVWKSSSLF